jgi:prepilin-type N-terminal cleavage/methylation domain-containing protein
MIEGMKKSILPSGFTLIEVMVVVAIISILATAVFSNFGGAREAAKDKAFAAELKEVQLAIELYKAQKGNYPPAQDFSGVSGCSNTTFFGFISDSISCTVYPVIDELVPNFIAELPDRGDSANTACNLVYQVSTDGSWYKLTAEQCHSEVATAAEGIQIGDPLARCASTCLTCDPSSASYYTSYAIYSDGGQCG